MGREVKMDKAKMNVLGERMKIYEIENLEQRLDSVKDTLSFLGFDTANRFKAYTDPKLNAVFSMYTAPSAAFLEKEGENISSYSQLEAFVKKYLGANVKMDFELTREKC
jgi:hypothetical protein